MPKYPLSELELDTSLPILYVLPYNSKTDLLTIRCQCLQLSLPDPLTQLEIDGCLLPAYVFIHDGPRLLSYFTSREESVHSFHNYLNLHRNNSQLDVQMLPVSVLFGRSPGREKQYLPSLRLLNGMQKFFTLLWVGRDTLVRFSNTVSFRQIADEHGTDTIIAQKLARVARMHFARQRLAAVGPRLPVKQELLRQLLHSPAAVKAIEDEARSKKISLHEANQNAARIVKEIAASFSYEAVRLSDRILSWLWNRLYQGINVHKAERIRRLAQEGHSLVYVPCHRSHMDYLLLSYVLYHQGLVPPHIAAGINLNFWPAGPIFRRLGAFFIRRSFKGNKLYSTLFREYLATLFARGYSVEYFIEGGRSRTGRLLEPKTGTLAMTIQALLRDGKRPITLVPVYIGYESVMEVGTYAKELRGAAKQKESLLQVLCTLSKLRSLGQGYVNFGEPIQLGPYLTRQVPAWREAINPIDTGRPLWLSEIATKLARQVMVNINNAAATNAINLCATALLASRQRALSREQLVEQLECYLQLLQCPIYSSDITLPEQSPSELLEHVLRISKFTIEQDNIGDLIILSRELAVLMTYYRNNIQHLFALPALIANIIISHTPLSRQEIVNYVTPLYPLLREELFLPYAPAELPEVVDKLLDELVAQALIIQQDNLLSLNPLRLYPLQLLAASTKETLQRYAITFSLLTVNPSISRGALEEESRIIAQRLSVLNGINSPEFFDKAVFSTLINTLRSIGHISDTAEEVPMHTRLLYMQLRSLLSPEVQLTIGSATISRKTEK